MSARTASRAALALTVLLLGGPRAEAQPEASDEPSLPRLVVRDFKNVFTTRENLFIVGAGMGAAWGASRLDERIRRSGFNTEIHEDGFLDRAFEPAIVLGGAAVQVGGAFAAYGLARLLSKPGVEELGRDLVRAQLVNQTLTQALKISVGRRRPDGSDSRSLPSGHASGSFATATVLQRRYGYKVGIPAFVFAGYIASSRVSEERHFLSDVVFGAAVGILAGRTVTLDLGGSRFAIAPTVAPDGSGAGIQLTWLGGGPR